MYDGFIFHLFVFITAIAFIGIVAAVQIKDALKDDDNPDMLK
jgi:energy-converting hydrogenase Eha subunit H